MSTKTELQDILDARGSIYGDFRINGHISQGIKGVMSRSPGWDLLANYQREALDLVALKISRILTGDPNYLDNWDDMAGYAQRVSQIISEDEARAREEQLLREVDEAARRATTEARDAPGGVPAAPTPIPSFLTTPLPSDRTLPDPPEPEETQPSRKPK